MSAKETMDKTLTALEQGYTKTRSFISFIKSLSIKSRADFECELDSTRKSTPLFRFSFGYDKNFKVFNILLIILAIFTVGSMLSCSKKEKKD